MRERLPHRQAVADLHRRTSRRALRAVLEDDRPALRELFADRSMLLFPGSSPLAGVYRDAPEVLGFFAAFALAAGGIVWREHVEEVAGVGAFTAMTTAVSGVLGTTLMRSSCMVVHLYDDNGRIARAAYSYLDQPEVDAALIAGAVAAETGGVIRMDDSPGR